LNGPISGAGGLEKTGGGTLVLTGANTFSGPTNVTNGTVRLGNVTSLLSSSSVSVQQGATLQLAVPGEQTFQFGGDIILRSTGGNGSTLQMTGVDGDIGTINSRVVLQDGGNLHTINVQGDSQLNLTGDVAGAGDLRKSGGGELRLLGGEKSFTGATEITNGRIRIDDSGVPVNTSAINLSGGNLRFGQGGTRTFSLGAGGAVPITFTADGSSIEKTDTGRTTLTNSLVVNAAGNIRAREAGSTFTLSGNLTGAGDLTFNVGTGGNPQQLGNIELTGDGSAFAGNVTLQQGTLTLGGNTTLGATNYTQNDGAILAVGVASPTQAGSINATGTATFNGASVITPVFESGLPQGLSPLTVVAAAGGVNVVGSVQAATSNVSPLLALSLNQTPNALQLLMNVDYTGANTGLLLNTNQQAVGNTLATAFGSGNPAFATLQAGALNQPNADAVREFYDAIAAEEVFSMSDVAFANARMQLRNVSNRVLQQRTGNASLGMTGIALGNQVEFGGADELWANVGDMPAGIRRRENPQERWSVFGNLNVTNQRQDRTPEIGGYTSATQGFTLGADRFVGPETLIGVYSGYDRSRTQFDRRRGYISADTATVGAFGSWLKEDWYATGAVQYNHHSYESERYSSVGTARGDTTGDQLSAMISGGYDFKQGRWSFGPTGSLTYSHLWIDGFSETGAPIAQRFGNHELDSLQLGVGGRVSYLFPGNFVSIRPEIRSEYRRELLDDDRTLQSTLIGGGPAFQLQSGALGKDFAVLGGGVTAVFSDSTTAFVNYEAEVGRADYVAHGVFGGVRWNFPGGPLRTPAIYFEDEGKDWRDMFWETPVGQAAKFINLRGLLHAQYDYAETDSKPGTLADPNDPDMESTLFIRRLRLYAERDLGGGFFIDGAGEYDEHAQNRPPVKLFNANAGWKGIDELNVLFGYDKVPLSFEENISGSRIKTVERSVASRTFTKIGDIGEQHLRLAAEGRFKDVLDGQVGILNRYDIRYETAVAHPSEEASALWDSDPNGTRSSTPPPSYYFRLHHELRTEWGDFDIGSDFAYATDFKARSSNQPTGAQAVSPFFNYNNGWFNFMAQWMGMTYTRDNSNGGTRHNPSGFTLQPSIYLHPKWELVGMYSQFDTNGDRAIRLNQSAPGVPTFFPSDRRFDNICQYYLGFNHYIKGNDLKLSAGVERIEVDGAAQNRPVSSEDAWVFRARLQVLF
jgi:outer membrane autotransporter protein